MAILSRSGMPAFTQLGHEDTNDLKNYAQTMLGHPHVLVEITEQQLELIIKQSIGFWTRFFPKEEKYAFFWTTPGKAEYPIPNDAAWIRQILWDPGVSRINDIFSAEHYLFNVGNITGINTLLTDYHLLLSFRKFAQRVLGIEGEWEYKVSTNTIRLLPLPKGSFPVIIQYIPTVTSMNSPQARELLNRAILAYTKIIVGHARRKYSSLPSPDGGGINLDGNDLISSGEEEIKKDLIEFAEQVGEPLSAYIM